MPGKEFIAVLSKQHTFNCALSLNQQLLSLSLNKTRADIGDKLSHGHSGVVIPSHLSLGLGLAGGLHCSSHRLELQECLTGLLCFLGEVKGIGWGGGGVTLDILLIFSVHAQAY